MKTEKIIALVKDYQGAVLEGVKSLNYKFSEDPTFHKATVDNVLERHGYIVESEKKTYYEFHGINGCYIKWENGKSVDFNLGIAGRCDGIDPWFVFNFYRYNEDVATKYQNITIEEIQEVISDLEAKGLMIKEELNRLYYFKEDYENSDPFRWAGGEYPSDLD